MMTLTLNDKILKYTIECRHAGDIQQLTAKFWISTSEIKENVFYKVIICQPNRSNHHCRGQNTNWTSVACTERHRRQGYYRIKCPLRPWDEEDSQIANIWFPKTFGLKVIVGRNAVKTNGKIIPITPLMRC